MKKVLITISAVAVVALAVIGGMVISSSNIKTSAEAVISLDETRPLKTGKYMRENGAENEYIEVFDDGTLQLYGYDFYKEVSESNGEDVMGSLEEEFKDELKRLGDYYLSRHEYKFRPAAKFVEFADLPEKGGGYGFIYDDEDTLVLNKEKGYVYHYQG